jgi:hypothetical protein
VSIVARQRFGKRPFIVAKQRLGKNPSIVASQRLGKSPLIVDRQRVGENPPIVARQRLGRNVTAVTNTRNNRRIVGRIVFNVAHVVTRKVGDWLFPELLVTFFISFCFTLSSIFLSFLSFYLLCSV